MLVQKGGGLRIAGAALVFTASSVAAQSAASADPDNDTNESQAGVGPQAGPNLHTYCFGNAVGATFENWVHDTNNVTSANSDFSDGFSSYCDRSGSIQTDVEWLVGSAMGSRGLTDCVAPSPQNGDCDRAIVIVDQLVIAQNSPDHYINNVRKTICHENGHTMGLTHYKNNGFTLDDADPEHRGGTQHNDCMASGGVNDDGIWRVFNHHHKAHINDNF